MAAKARRSMSTFSAVCFYLIQAMLLETDCDSVTQAQVQNLDSLKTLDNELQDSVAAKDCESRDERKAHKTSCDDNEDTKKRSILLSNSYATIPETVFQAVKQMVPDWISNPGNVVKMAVNLCLISTNKIPESSQDLLAVILDNGCSENGLLARFVTICTENGGLKNVPFFQKSNSSLDELRHENKFECDRIDTETDGPTEKPDPEQKSDAPIPPPSPHQNFNQTTVSESGPSSVPVSNATDDSSSRRTPCNTTPNSIDCSDTQNITTAAIGISTVLTENSFQLPKEKSQDDRRNRLLDKALEREHKRLLDSTLCVLCTKSPKQVTLLPCGHFVLCSKCSEQCYVCPVCEAQVLAEVKTFLS